MFMSLLGFGFMFAKYDVVYVSEVCLRCLIIKLSKPMELFF